MCGAPADAATSRSPVASITTSPRIASRPLLVSQTTPRDAAVFAPARARTTNAGAGSMPAARPPSRARRASSRRGRTRRRSTIGCGLSCVWKSKAPQRVQRLIALGRGAPLVLAREARPGRARPGARSGRGRCRAPRSRCSVAVPHVVEHQHHAARGQAAEVVVALEQDGRGAVARRGERRRHAGRAAADHHHVGLRDHLDVARRLAQTESLRYCRIMMTMLLGCKRWGLREQRISSVGSGCQRMIDALERDDDQEERARQAALITIAAYSSGESKL